MPAFIENEFPARPKPMAVVKPGEFVFSAMYLEHGHLYGMTGGLIQAGATLKSFYDPDPEKVAAFTRAFPQVKAASSEEEILMDPEVRLVAAAAVTNRRADLGCRVMRAGKDYFTDKAPMTTLPQVEMARACCAETGQKYLCYYCERLTTESSAFADELIQKGAIGRVLHVEGFGPHRLNPGIRPDWFFDKEQSGGILCDIGSHQIEQYLHYAGETEAEVVSSRTANHANPGHPNFEDFGDCVLTGRKGTSFYCRVDWFTPDGLREFGDSRTFILGTEGTLELRKTVDVGVPEYRRDVVILVDKTGERMYHVQGKIGEPYWGRLILDCIHHTEHVMTQEHCFKAAELCIIASQNAVRIR
jgi:predicted dehydrogenase